MLFHHEGPLALKRVKDAIHVVSAQIYAAKYLSGWTLTLTLTCMGTLIH